MLIINRLNTLTEYLEALDRLTKLYRDKDTKDVPEMQLEQDLLEMIVTQYEKENEIDGLSSHMSSLMDNLGALTKKGKKHDEEE